MEKIVAKPVWMKRTEFVRNMLIKYGLVTVNKVRGKDEYVIKS